MRPHEQPPESKLSSMKRSEPRTATFLSVKLQNSCEHYKQSNTALQGSAELPSPGLTMQHIDYISSILAALLSGINLACLDMEAVSG